MRNRIISLVFAFTALIAGGALTYHYPIAQPFPIIGFIVFASLVYVRPWVWPILLPCILPVAGLAPWTGWITFEELDLLVLATVAGGYFKRALSSEKWITKQQSKVFVVLAGFFALSLLISMFRGFEDAGGFIFGLYQGYNGPMNSLRIAKSFFLALLLVPLMRQLNSQDETRFARYLGAGFAAGLGLVSLSTIWERLAFTDLLNFSSDYRSTGLFWEMHVGGAALDGWLVLAFPFAIWALRSVKKITQAVPLLVLVGVASYASLTTFSRGVYLALGVSLALLAWLLNRRENSRNHNMGDSVWTPMKWGGALLVIGVLAALVFPGSGYRGLLALIGVLIIGFSIPSAIQKIKRSKMIVVGVAGGVLGLALIGAVSFIPKGAYVLYALLFFISQIALHWPDREQTDTGSLIGLGGFFSLAIAAVNVSIFWGGEEAATGMVLAMIIVLALVMWGAFSSKPIWPNDIRWQGTMLTISLAASVVVAVFSGGSYMGDRFSTSSQDADGRLEHWKRTVFMLQSPLDFVFGKGLGRFPANYYFLIPNSAVPGTYSISHEDNNGFLTLTGGGHPISFGDLMRVSQRLSFSAQGPFDLELKVRTKSDVNIHVEVCEKQLLYVAQCAIQNTAVKAGTNQWQSIKMRLDGPLLNGGVWYAPRLKMFSIGVETQAGAADIDDLILTEFGSQNLLANQHFSNEMQRWFFSSDRDHMPWHAKNLQMNTLFDQGIFGLITSTFLLLAALWRLNVSKASSHPLAPYLTSGIIGFLVVGLFDSLTDVPRLAFVFYLLLIYSIVLTEKSSRNHKKFADSRAH